MCIARETTMGLCRRDALISMLIAVCWMGMAPTLSQASINDTQSNIITRDICVIGGGSSGTYAAIRLRDLGQSVIVVESDDHLGGHTNTYTDPLTQAHVDYGVIGFHNLDIVKNYFGRFDIPLVVGDLSALAGLTQKYVDFRTGTDVPNYIPSNATTAFAAYVEQLAKYPYLETGFDLPYPVPEDLLLPFGDFVKKYAIEEAVQIIFSYGQGVGDLLAQRTIYVLKIFNLALLQDLLTGFLTTARGDNSELYEKALASLGADVLLRSKVVSTNRKAGGCAELKVDTPSGQKTIRAKKIVLTIPPKLENLGGFDLDENETSLFSQFLNTGYYTALLRNTGIPDNVSVTNVAADTPYNLPVLPGLYNFVPTGIPGLGSVKYGSPYNLTNSQVQADIVASIVRLQNAGLQTTIPEFAAYNSHTPFELTVSADAIENGFYNKLYALQGWNRMWYTGAAFHTHDSTKLWIFTEALLPRIVAG